MGQHKIHYNMDISNWEMISSKYLLKYIFSYLKIPTTLKLIKRSQKIRTKLEITLFHYQYYCFFILFKNVKIETIDNILASPYLEKFPEEVKFELIMKLIETRKLFNNDCAYLNIFDKNYKTFIHKLMEKQNTKKFNYLIGDNEIRKKLSFWEDQDYRNEY